MPAHPQAVKVAYAAASGITVHGAARTRFLYVASNHVRAGEVAVGGLDTSALAPGDYLLRALAEDAAGNRATGRTDLPLRVLASDVSAGGDR
jgi:hypothetical protein